VRSLAATLDRAIEVEDVSMAIVTFANRAVASVVNSALSPRQETYLRIDYQKATVELTHLYSYARDNWRLTLAPSAQDEGLLQSWQSFPSTDIGSTHAAQLAALVCDMDAGARPLTSGHEARRTIELLTAIYKSAFTGEVVRAGSIGPGDPFYNSIHGGGIRSLAAGK
jgi:predicted dehydrogenase